MKIRNGFVSNSSSSSFILMFENIPSSKEELKKILYGENPPVFDSYYSNEGISTDQVISIVWNDIKNESTHDSNNISSVIRSEKGNFDQYNIDEVEFLFVGTKYINEFNELKDLIFEEEKNQDNIMTDFYKNKERYENITIHNLYMKHSDRLQEISDKIYKLLDKITEEEYKNKKFILTQYSDNDGSVFSYLEHSGILEPITFQRTSKH